jgi:transposase-like protein
MQSEEQFAVKSNGKKIYPTQFKDRVIAEMKSGKVSPAELARRYGMPIQNIHRWVRKARQGEDKSYAGADPETMIPVSEAKRIAAEYEVQIRQLKKSLANMTLDRDILKDAVEIASKKKWI